MPTIKLNRSRKGTRVLGQNQRKQDEARLAGKRLDERLRRLAEIRERLEKSDA